MPTQATEELLKAAILGYEQRIVQFQQKIAELRSSLNGAAQRGLRQRNVSAAARKRMAAGQQKRWAEYRATQPGGRSTQSSATASTQQKPTFSAAARKKLSLAAKRRWARLKKENPGAVTLGG